MNSSPSRTTVESPLCRRSANSAGPPHMVTERLGRAGYCLKRSPPALEFVLRWFCFVDLFLSFWHRANINSDSVHLNKIRVVQSITACRLTQTGARQRNTYIGYHKHPVFLSLLGTVERGRIVSVCQSSSLPRNPSRDTSFLVTPREFLCLSTSSPTLEIPGVISQEIHQVCPP